VSGYVTNCPSCGAELVFSLGSTLLKVCDYCGVAVARKGANVASYGKVAELIPTPSILKLGLEGGYQGAPRFTLAGRVQIDHGSGTWDEWLMAFSDGSTAWLSEAQGHFHYMGEIPLPPLPAFDELEVGRTVDLGPSGVFVITEVRSGRFVTGQGELPFDVEPGSELHYADLSGPQGQLGTLDYGTGTMAEAAYVGREVTVEEMGIKDLPDEEERRVRAAAGSMSCTQCGGPIELRAPGETQRVACPYCGSLLDATKNFAVIEALESVPVKPLIPLGSKGKLAGVTWTAIGFMVRSTTVEGVVYAWREYLLYEPKRGFRWLVEANGHWSFVESVPAGQVHASLAGASCQGQTYRHFQGGTARVEHVLGEFYWAVARGDRTETGDYVAPPVMLSKERSEGEINWSRGVYTPPDEVRQAFALKQALPTPTGVAPHQPWPYAAQWASIKWQAMMFLSVIAFLFMFLTITGRRSVHHQDVTLQGDSGTPEAVAFVGPMEISRQGNVQISVQAPVSNSWLYLDGALINEDTGGVDAFDLEVAYYSGRDSDGSWTEGSQSRTTYLGAVPPGKYLLRLAPQWDKARKPDRFTVDVRSGVPRFYHAFLAFLGIAAWPMMVLWRRFRFERQRWSESDHPWVESE